MNVLLLLLSPDENISSEKTIEALFFQAKDTLVFYAHSLLQDEHLAEDIVQTAFQIVLAKPHLSKYTDAEKTRHI